MEPKKRESVSRRKFVKASAGVVAAGTLLGKRAFAAPRSLKIGYVSPETGALASFGGADAFVTDEIRKAVQGGIQSGGTTRQVEIIVKDSQSSANRCAQVTAELIKADRVDLVVAGGTGDTTNPVSDQCEINQQPCVTTDTPWQANFFGRGGNPAKGFDWTYHFFWGLEVFLPCMADLLTGLPTNGVVGLLMGDDLEGNMFSGREHGCPPVFEARGLKVFDPGRFQLNTTDFSAVISAMKKGNAETMFVNLPQPVFSTFWGQAAQQGYKPKIAVVTKAMLYPSDINSQGPLGKNLSIEVWWTNHHPFKSSLTGVSSMQLCDRYEEVTKKQWAQTLGFRHALFEVAIDVFKRAQNPESEASVIDAVRNTKINTIVGPVQWLGTPPNQWTTIPVKNVCTTPMVGGQWVPGKKWPYEIAVVDNRRYPQIPVTSKMAYVPA
jgi:branched-chain amino acid transport system substrate-binding protein